MEPTSEDTDGEREQVTDLEGEVAELEHEIADLENEVEEGKVAHPIELFFDLVYVFAFTRVVGLIVHDHNLESALKGALILALLWWSWGTWTWTMNAVDLTNRMRRVAILASMLGVFIMGFAVPTAFEGDSAWFAAGYVLTRFLAGVVAWFGTVDDPIEHAAMRSFLPVSAPAPALIVIGALVGGDALPWIWLLAAAIEVGSALLAANAEWHIDAGHFAERHGLITIIALGEAIIAVGVAVTAAAGDNVDVTSAVVWRLGIGLVGVCTLWWAYFDKMQVIWERALEDASPQETGTVGRDVYSLAHYPMIAGIVFFAVGLEEAFLHPLDPPTTFNRWMLATAVALYLLSQAAATYRCWGAIAYERIAGVVVVVAFVALADMKAELVVLIMTLLMIATMGAEYFRFREEVKASPHLRR
ncbi:MAG: low temperature requirement protein A [Acidimicrobiales bacterium]